MKSCQHPVALATLLCIALGVSTDALAVRKQNNDADPAEPEFRACAPNHGTGRAVCKPLPMPANAVGRVGTVLPVDIIKGADTSWLARGDKRTSLCYTGLNWRGARETVCKPVPYTKAMDGYTIQSVKLKDGSPLFLLTRKPGTPVSPHEMVYAQNFTIGVMATSQALQKIASRRQDNSTVAKGPPNSLVNNGGNGSGGGSGVTECQRDDEGGTFCTSRSDSGGYEDPFGSGHAGDPAGNSSPAGTTSDEIPIDAIPVPDWPSGYPGSTDEPGPFDQPVSNDELANNSGQGSNANGTIIVCLPTPLGPPICAPIATVTITGTANSHAFDAFAEWLRSLWNNASPKWASSNGSYGPIYDREAAICDRDWNAINEDNCEYEYRQGRLDASGRRACLERNFRAYAACLSRARAAQKQWDDMNNGIIANRQEQL